MVALRARVDLRLVLCVLGLDELLQHLGKHAIVAAALGLVVGDGHRVGCGVGDHYAKTRRLDHGHVVGRVAAGNGVGDVDAKAPGQLA